MTRSSLRSCLLLLAVSGAAYAQSSSDPGVGAGALAELSRGRNGAAAAPSAGLHLRARLTGGIALEGLVAFRRERVEAAGERLLTITEVPVQGSAILFFLFRTRVQPYLLGGIGYYWVRGTGEGSNAAYGSRVESKFGFHAGGGVEARLAPRLSLVADARYVWLDVDALSALQKSHGVATRGDFFHAGAGLTFYF